MYRAIVSEILAKRFALNRREFLSTAAKLPALYLPFISMGGSQEPPIEIPTPRAEWRAPSLL